MWRPGKPEGIRRLKLRESTYNLWNQRKESLIMRGMTNSEFAEIIYIRILLSVNTVIDLIDPTTLEHEDKVSFAIIN